ncbi:MAG: hypothetical protein KF754_08170 [Planctomycetes bacterium]|nr:hypothetical protein [Planctomycetota bacterium]
MQTLQPVRVPARVVAVLAFWILACGTTEEYQQPYYQDPNPSYTPPPQAQPQPEYVAPAKPAEPAAPTIPSYVAELDRNQPPQVAKTIDVTIQGGAPQKPTDDIWTSLSARYGVAISDNNPNRGNGNDPLILYDFKLGFGDHQVTLAAVAESKTVYNADGSSTKLAHGLGFCTFDNSRARMQAKSYYRLDDPYTYALGYFRDGRMHGPWAFNLEDEARTGTQVMRYIAEYTANQANGEVRFFNRQGYLVEQCWAVAGVRHGSSYQWFEGGSIATSFVGGVQYGQCLEFNAAGQMTVRGTIYRDSYYGRTEFWYPGSDQPCVVRYFDFGPDRGWATYYDKDGALHHQSWIEDGAQTGPWVSYTKGGFKQWQGPRVKGVAHGAFQRFHADGWVDLECEYVEGKQTGPIRWLYQTGKVREEGRMEKGIRQGEFKSWREDGSLQWIADWKDGQSGKVTYYDAQGKVERVEGDPLAGLQAAGWTWIDNGDLRARDATNVALAFNPETGRCLMFGGEDLEQSLSATHEFDGTKWAELLPRRTPPDRSGAILYWDVGRKRLRLAGGYSFFEFDTSASEAQKDVWEWDGRIWGLADDGEGGPHEVLRSRAAYDPQRKVLVVIGRAPDADSWHTFLFDGEHWTRKPGVESTDPAAAQLVWDPSAGKVAMWLPSESTGAAAHRAWHWDGEAWQKGPATLVPPEGSVFSACADEGRKGLWANNGDSLLFYDGTHWVAYEKPQMVNTGTIITVDPKSGRVFAQGSLSALALGTNESWWFDPDQGKRK